jgi:hypothetical protein
MADNYDTYYRTKPKLQILQGWDPNEPRTRARSAPIQSGATIYSGHIIALEWNSSDSVWEWVLADSADAEHRKQAPHVAQDDGDAVDVRGSGQLVGLSCSGQFEFQSGYFTNPGAPPLTAGIALSYGTGGDVGKLIPVARGGGPTVPVIGMLSGVHHAGPINVGNYVNSDGVLINGTNSEAAAGTDSDVVQWVTHYDGQNAAS